MRVYLTGSLCLEAGEHLLVEEALPGPQGRHLLGFLAAEHARPLSREELASEVWPVSLPPAWESSLKAIISKVRAALSRAGLPGTELIRNAFGAYQFRLPSHGWVDLDAAVTRRTARERLAAADARARRGGERRYRPARLRALPPDTARATGDGTVSKHPRRAQRTPPMNGGISQHRESGSGQG